MKKLVVLKLSVVLISCFLMVSCGFCKSKAKPLIERITPAPINGGFKMADKFLWGPTVIKGEDGKYHMFADYWDKSEKRIGAYYQNTEVCHAISDTPEGPFKFVEIAISKRPDSYWDKVSCHTSCIIKYKDTYVLYYSSYNGQDNFVGYALSKSLYGPWERQDEPICYGKNPAACITPAGDILFVFRNNYMRLYTARAKSPDSEYVIYSKPIVKDVEDPFVWYNGSSYEMIAEDNRNKFTGSRLNGVHFKSKDGFKWEVADPVKAYGHPVEMDDGTFIAGRQEKPWMLIGEKGYPTHLYLVKDEGKSRHYKPAPDNPDAPMWIIAIPLADPE